MATLSLVTLGGHTATHCNVARVTATIVVTFATHCNAASATVTLVVTDCDRMQCTQHDAMHCDTMQCTATRCNALRHDATHCNAARATATLDTSHDRLRHDAMHFDTTHTDCYTGTRSDCDCISDEPAVEHDAGAQCVALCCSVWRESLDLNAVA